MTTSPVPTVSDELPAEIERAAEHKHCDVPGAALSAMAIELRTLRAENAELRGDAGRYDWISTATPYRFKKIQDASLTDGGDLLYFHRDRFNAAIDAAMAGESK